jgi:drug/metabolite transporter superfamily protein YnfA
MKMFRPPGLWRTPDAGGYVPEKSEVLAGNRARHRASAMMLTWTLMLLAAAFEVAGDALIRHGLVSGASLYVLLGFLVLGSYGIIVNLVGLDFARLLGAYVGWFAAVSIIVGRLVFDSRLTPSLLAGLALVLAGSLVIQLGERVPGP